MTNNILHITNGDGASEPLKQSNIEGDVLPWRDPMHHGPFPSCKSLDELAEIRAKYLSGPGINYDETLRGFQLRDSHLQGFRKYDEVVLWFEHDLLDQLQILQILDWFKGQELGDTKLTTICINEFEGINPFRGLGQLSSEQFEGLFPERQAVTEGQLNLAQTGWSVFRSNTPEKLEALIKTDLSAFPPNDDMDRDVFKAQQLELTDLGEEVLQNKTNAVPFLNLDYWLGGVHLKGNKPLWRWDESEEHMMLVDQPQ